MNIPTLNAYPAIPHYLNWVNMELDSNQRSSNVLSGLNSTRSFIKIRDRPIVQCSAKPSNMVGLLGQHDVTNTSNQTQTESKIDELCETTNFETYKQLKSVAKDKNPAITKHEIYEKLLKPFKHSKVQKYDPKSGKTKVILYCKYGD